MISQPMRLAWFSPLPPVRSGIAAYSSALLPLLTPDHAIDRFEEANAHDFVWKARRDPYDLPVYQLGNAPCHDYMWAYLAAYPGLVVLHDARLHHARARRLLNQKRFDDYRHEFWYDDPDARRDFVEYAVEGLGGPIYYFWPMLRVVMRTARLVAVHNERVAVELRDAFPDTQIEAIHLGKSSVDIRPATRATMRAALEMRDTSIVFAAFGKLTAEKRIATMLRSFTSVVGNGIDARLLLVGDASDYPSLQDELATHRIAGRVHVTGHVADESIAGYLAAADVCLCLRWPTAQETSASWLHCLAAARPTVITDLAHLVDIPTLDPRDQRTSPGPVDPVAIRIDLLDEEPSLTLAMRRLAQDSALRARLARAGHAYWLANHTMDVTANDYRRIIKEAALRPTPAATDLPAHFTNDHTRTAREIARRFELTLDILS